MTLRTMHSLSTALIFSAVLLASCGGNQTAVIDGTISGAEGKTVFLQRFENGRTLNTDSSVVAADGSFSIVPSPALDHNFFRLFVDAQNSIVFIGDSVSGIQFTATYGAFESERKVKGNRDSELLFGFYDKVRPMVEQEQELSKKTKNPSVSSEERSQALSQLVELKKAKREACLQFIEQNPGSPAAMAALEELNFNEDKAAYQKVLDGLKGTFDHTVYYKRLVDQFANAERQEKLKSQPQKNGLYSTGMDAPDIVMADPSGQPRKLSDLRGKVVLIDFWASWCGPCRRENPSVVRTYNQYKSKGFEIFSVSLDSDKAKWQAAIAQDGLIWENHVSDLQGWQNGAAQQYGISSIPHTILVGPDGKIIATHLRGPQLEQALKAEFGS